MTPPARAPAARTLKPLRGVPRLNLLPFVVQESGPHFRAARTFAIRGIYLAVCGAGLAVAAQYVSGGDTGAFARQLYNTLYWTTYVTVCLLAPVLTAHAVFRDKVAGLASVIASAPVTPLEYCLGRVLGQMASLAAILVTAVPLVVTMVFLHAVTLGEVVKGMVCLALAALLSTSLALGRAIDGDSFPAAVASTYALTAFPGCLTPLWWLCYGATEPNVHASFWAYIVVATPIPLLYNLFRSTTLFRRHFVSEGSAPPPWLVREGRYRGPVGVNPVYWWERTRAARILEKHFGRADSLSGAVRILAGLAVLASLIPLCLHPVGVGALFGMGVLAATAQAASSVTTDREQKVWPTLLTTPLAPSQVVSGKLLGILSGLRLVWLAAGLGLSAHLLLGDLTGVSRGKILDWGLRLPAFAAILVTAALHASLMAPTTAKAMGYTVGFGLALGAPPFLLENLGLVRLTEASWSGVGFAWMMIAAMLAWLLPAHYERAAARLD